MLVVSMTSGKLLCAVKRMHSLCVVRRQVKSQVELLFDSVEFITLCATFTEGHPTSIFGKYLFGRRLEI